MTSIILPVISNPDPNKEVQEVIFIRKSNKIRHPSLSTDMLSRSAECNMGNIFRVFHILYSIS